MTMTSLPTGLDVAYRDAFFAAYVQCALWSSIDWDNDDTPLDENYGPEDIDAASLAAMRAECDDFITANELELIAYGRTFDGGYAGHDFWLTKNHHGAGFWDRGVGEVGDCLTTAAHAYGSTDLYVHNGAVHAS